MVMTMKTSVVREAIFSGTLAGCKNVHYDLVFILDASSSVGKEDFEKVRQWVSNLVETFEIGPDKTRVGVVRYSDRPTTEFDLGKYKTREEIKEAARKIKYYGGNTNTGDALRYINTYSFSKEAGGRLSDRTVKKVAILLTDGRSQDYVLDPATVAHRAGIRIFAVGVGEALKEELDEIASEPKSAHVFHVSDYNAIDKIRGKLRRRLCETLSISDAHLQRLVHPILKLVCKSLVDGAKIAQIRRPCKDGVMEIREQGGKESSGCDPCQFYVPVVISKDQARSKADVLCPNVHVEGDRFKHTNGGTDEIPGFDLMESFSVKQIFGMKENGIQSAYVRLGSFPVVQKTEDVFPQGLPDEYAFVTTFKFRKASRKEDWYIWQIIDKYGIPQVSIRLDGENKALEYNAIGLTKDAVRVVFRNARVGDLFDRSWHKIALSIQSKAVSLYIDCRLVQMLPIEDRENIDIQGKTVIGKRLYDSVPIDFDLQRMVIYCDSRHAELETCCDIPSGPCQVTVLTEAPPLEVRPTVGNEQVGHLKTVNCSCPAGQKGERGPIGPEGPKGQKNGRAMKLQKDDDDNNKNTLQQHPIVFRCFDKVYVLGESGSQGLPGLRGEKGESGRAYGRGEKGEKGDEGLPGFPGLKGDKGEKGSLGSPGPPGKDGAKGEAGEPGQPGAFGLPGPPGPKGSEGKQGLPGIKGYVGAPTKPQKTPLVYLGGDELCSPDECWHWIHSTKMCLDLQDRDYLAFASSQRVYKEKEEKREHEETRESLGHEDHKANLDFLDLQESLVWKENLESLVYQVKGDLQGPQVLLDPQDHLEHQDCQEKLEFLVKLDHQDQLVNKEKKVRKAFLEKLALRVNQGAVANVVSREKKEKTVSQDSKVKEEKRVTQVPPDHQAYLEQVNLDRKGRKEIKEQAENLDCLGSQVNKVSQDLQEYRQSHPISNQLVSLFFPHRAQRDRKELKAKLEPLESLVYLEAPDYQEKKEEKGKRVILEKKEKWVCLGQLVSQVLLESRVCLVRVKMENRGRGDLLVSLGSQETEACQESGWLDRLVPVVYLVSLDHRALLATMVCLEIQGKEDLLENQFPGTIDHMLEIKIQCLLTIHSSEMTCKDLCTMVTCALSALLAHQDCQASQVSKVIKVSEDHQVETARMGKWEMLVPGVLQAHRGWMAPRATLECPASLGLLETLAHLDQMGHQDQWDQQETQER
ncbi:Col22a1 [Columba guinea]|nr:Col22a1 [Columba guinea]